MEFDNQFINCLSKNNSRAIHLKPHQINQDQNLSVELVFRFQCYNSTALLMKQLTVIAPVKVIKVYHHDGEVSPFEEFFRLVFEAENFTPPIDLTSKMVKGGSRRGFVSSFCVLGGRP